ncbi:hypothetical protein LZL87_010524 [Fusarium oxysporum]|nr:hypothetical protein LZL87_010524 [Fusarium oxysporum]
MGARAASFILAPSSTDPNTDDGSQSSAHESQSSPEDEFPGKGRVRIPGHLLSIQAIQDLGYSLTIQVEDDKIIIPKALGMNHVEELINLSEKYQKSLPVVRATHRPFFTWASKADNDRTNISDTTAIRVLSWLRKMVSHGKVSRLCDQTMQFTIEDLIQRYDLFGKKPEESAAEERRILVLKVVVGSDGESADEEPQTMGEFVYYDEVEGGKHVRKVTTESADEDSDEEKQDMPWSISRESPRSERSFPESVRRLLCDTMDHQFVGFSQR